MPELARLAAGLREAKNPAREEQQKATSLQWVAYRARVELGEEKVGARGATKLGATRDWKHFGSPPGFAGLLDVDVLVIDGVPSVSGAHIVGISKLVADRLLDVDLRTAHIPVRFVVNGGAAIVTCDELGRIRCAGDTRMDPDSDPRAGERQLLLGAERLANIVFGKTLHAWGLEHVVSDDRSV